MLITNIIYVITTLVQVWYMTKVYNIHIYVYKNIVIISLNNNVFYLFNNVFYLLVCLNIFTQYIVTREESNLGA